MIHALGFVCLLTCVPWVSPPNTFPHQMTSTGPNTNTSHASGESHPPIIISTPVQQNTWDDEKNQRTVNLLSWQPGCSTSELSRITDWPQNLYRRQNYFPPCNFQIDFQFKNLINTNQMSTWIKWLCII